MTSKLKFLLFYLILACLSSCATPSLSDEKAAILELHHAQRTHHFNKDSIAFVNQFSDDFLSVNRGEISRPTREATLSRYNGYFSSVDFVKWDDLAEPIILFSDDGSLAYTVVDKLVVVAYPDDEGKVVQGQTHFAWTAIYRKVGGEWKVECVTSTESPE